MMHQARLRNDTLLEIATFLVRRWSGYNDITVGFAARNQPKTSIRDRSIAMLGIEKYQGDGFQQYRQFRTSLWYESMRLRHCTKILSNDHAFGFILNTIETRRIEMLGREVWNGMDAELVFGYAYAMNYRPHLSSIYGRARIVEAFYQAFMLGGIKGEVQPSHFERVQEAAAYADGMLAEAVRDGRQTDWLEKRIPEIIKILDIDSLLTIPMSLPWMKQGMAMTEEEILKALVRIAKNREGDFGKVDPASALRGDNIYPEYSALMNEDKKSENRRLGTEGVGVQVPLADGVDEAPIYDRELINRIKSRFKEWKTGWSEQNMVHGDEFDEDAYVDGGRPFFTDVRRKARARIMILLDHSSSIAADHLEYKKATLALCEVLSYLKIGFSVYAFSTKNKAVVCWMIKHDRERWGSSTAKRLAGIVANGSTPLAEVYDKMSSVIQAGKPEIFLTLTDGEPSDPDAVRVMIKSLRITGVSMCALGLGPDVVRATTIASNLKKLGYEKTIAVSRLHDIPNKVMGILKQAQVRQGPGRQVGVGMHVGAG